MTEKCRGRPRTRQDNNGDWFCHRCKKYKPLDKFYLMKPWSRPQSRCKACLTRYRYGPRGAYDTRATPTTLKGSRY